MTDKDSIISELPDVLARCRHVSLYWSEPGSHVAVWESDGRIRTYFNLRTSLDESRRPAIELLAAKFGLKCKKVRGTDGFDSLQLDLPRERKELTEVLQQVLSDVFGVRDWSEVRLSHGNDV